MAERQQMVFEPYTQEGLGVTRKRIGDILCSNTDVDQELGIYHGLILAQAADFGVIRAMQGDWARLAGDPLDSRVQRWLLSEYGDRAGSTLDNINRRYTDIEGTADEAVRKLDFTDDQSGDFDLFATHRTLKRIGRDLSSGPVTKIPQHADGLLPAIADNAAKMTYGLSVFANNLRVNPRMPIVLVKSAGWMACGVTLDGKEDERQISFDDAAGTMRVPVSMPLRRIIGQNEYRELANNRNLVLEIGVAQEIAENNRFFPTTSITEPNQDGTGLKVPLHANSLLFGRAPEQLGTLEFPESWGKHGLSMAIDAVTDRYKRVRQITEGL